MILLRCVVAVGLLTWLSSSVAAQTDGNAATWYQRAIDQLQRLRESSPSEWELLLSYDPAVAPTAEYRAALARAQPMIQLARQGAGAEFCNFNLDYNAGVELMLPHLNSMRGLAKIIHYDAHVRLHDGDAKAAADLLGDVYRMSSHFRDDRVAISSLVGNAVFALSDRAVQTAIDQGVMGAQESASLVAALENLDQRDPFGFVEAVAGEQDMMVSWLRTKAASPEFMQELNGMMGGNGVELPMLMMTPERFEEEIELYDETMGRMVEIFMMPDREEAKLAMTAMEEEIHTKIIGAQAGGEGILIGMMLPAMGKLLERRDASEKMLAERLTMLRALAGGAAKPADFANAALWYLRGIAVLREMNEEALAEVRTFAADTSAPLSQNLSDWLAKPFVQDAIAIFREGSTKRRCDFAAALPFNRNIQLAPPHAIGMHEALRLIQADAVRLLRADQKEIGADLLGVCLRMTGHLGGDPCIVSSLCSHFHLKKTADLLQTGLANGMLDDGCRADLFESMEMNGRADPFGYIKAILTTRDRLAKTLSQQRWPLNEDANAESRSAFEQSVKELNADQVLFLLTVVDAMQQNAAALDASNSVHPRASDTDLSKLADIIALAKLQNAQDLVPRIAPDLASGDLTFFETMAVPTIAWSKAAASLSDHVRRARSDLRDAFAALRDASAEAPIAE